MPSQPPPRRPEALVQWSRAAIPAKFSGSDGERRRRVIVAVAQSMHRASAERRRRHLVRRTCALAAAVVGLFVLAGGVLHGRDVHSWLGRAHPNLVASPASVLVGQQSGQDGTASDRSSPSPSAPHAPVATSHDLASRLQLASGVDVRVGTDTRLFPPDKDQRSDQEELVLDVGFVHIDVPKLPLGHTFTVRTPDALVVVHGTSFSVEVTKSGPSALPVTRVVVSVGVVTVRHGESEVLLGSGMEWASSNEALEPVLHRGRTVSAANAESAASTSRSQQRHGSTQRSEHEAAPVPSARSAPSLAPNSSPAPEPAVSQTDLAEQNHSFAEAMLAREHGDLGRAVRILDNFVRRYPGSPLAQDASVERFRTLVRLGDYPAAAREARRYLTLYQSGFARDEARALALEPTGGND